MTFNHPSRPRPTWGRLYRSECGQYALYYGDRIDGSSAGELGIVAIWRAIWLGPNGQRIISRHRKRSAAEKACRSHAWRARTTRPKRRRRKLHEVTR